MALPTAVRPEALKVFVRALTVLAEIGVHPHEHGRTQPLRVDIEVELDTPGVVHGIADTVNYDTLADAARRLAAHTLTAQGHVELVETFAVRLARACLAPPRVRRVRVRVEKPEAVADAEAAGVVVELARPWLRSWRSGGHVVPRALAPGAFGPAAARTGEGPRPWRIDAERGRLDGQGSRPMTDPFDAPGRGGAYPFDRTGRAPGQGLGEGPGDKTLAIAVYVLFLLGFLTGWLTTIAGVVMAYALRDGAGELARSHYLFQIRTFWISLLWIVVAGAMIAVGVPLSVVLIGIPIIVAGGLLMTGAAIWFAVRCIVGLLTAAGDRAYDRPRTWLL